MEPQIATSGAVGRPGSSRVVPFLAAALLLAALGACADDEPSGAAPTSGSVSTTAIAAPDCRRPSTCTTRQLADAAGVLLGAAVAVDHLDEPEYRSTLLATFNSVTPENALKWASIHPGPDEWDFGPIDELVAFATANGLAVKGHNLIWEQQVVDSTPDWVLGITDPDELRAVVRRHITTVMDRYRGTVDRWDVVNEPFQTLGSELHPNHFQQVLGDDYIAEMFEIAHEADPSARLFLNEATVELLPDKAAALVSLVEGLVARGVPIDGVGLQGHLVAGSIAPGIFRSLIDQLDELGVEVAVTELDVPLTDAADPLDRQASTYGQVLDECFAEACREVTLWGFTDRYTWIDDTFGPGRAPLPFDREYRPKPALDAMRAALVRAAERGASTEVATP